MNHTRTSAHASVPKDSALGNKGESPVEANTQAIEHPRDVPATQANLDARNLAIHAALDLHRGKALSAQKIVEEALVFERYFREGKVTLVAGQPAPDAPKMPPVS